jgi:hypothetical protein
MPLEGCIILVINFLILNQRGGHDIKHENILYFGDGERILRLADFGSRKIVGPMSYAFLTRNPNH